MNRINPDTTNVQSTNRSRETILRERARQLARPSRRGAVVREGREALIFSIQEERYALPVSHLNEVYTADTLTPLPGTPEFILGVFAVRGQVVAVMDLRVLLGHSSTEPSPESLAVVFGGQAMTTAILVDRVEGIVTIENEDLEAGEASGSQFDPRLVSGVTRDGVILLAAERILSNPDFIVTQ